MIIKSDNASAIHLEGSAAEGEVVEYISCDEMDGKIFHELKQDIEPTLKHIEERRLNEGRDIGKSKSGDWYHAARVDLVVVLAWLNKHGLKMHDFKGEVLTKFLNDSENAPFRIWSGKVS